MSSNLYDARPRQWYDPRPHRRDRRTFSAETKRLAWKRCGARCEFEHRITDGSGQTISRRCDLPLFAGNIIYDHVIAWEISRNSSLANCQVICVGCNREKTA